MFVCVCFVGGQSFLRKVEVDLLQNTRFGVFPSIQGRPPTYCLQFHLNELKFKSRFKCLSVSVNNEIDACVMYGIEIY